MINLELGNAQINKLLDLSEKHYENSAVNINLCDVNNSLTQIISCIKENSKVLDVGCSYGYLGEWLVKNKKCKMYGIEIDERELKEVQKSGFYESVYKINLDNVNLSDAEARKLLNLDVCFDYIICADVIEHLKFPHEIFNELGGKLKYNGKFIVSIPNISNIDILMCLINGKFNYSNYGILDNTHIKFFTKHSFAEWIYNCNDQYFDNFKLDLMFKGCTTFETELVLKFKRDYNYLYNLLLDGNKELNVLQNIFVLTKKEKESKCSELEKFIKAYRYVIKEEYDDIVNQYPSLPLNENIEIKYEFICKNDNIKGISVFVGTYNSTVDSCLNMSLYLENEVMPFWSKKYMVRNIKDNSWVNLQISDTMSLKNKKVIIKIVGDLKKDDKMSIWLNKDREPIIKILYYDDFDFWRSDENYLSLEKINDNIGNLIRMNEYYIKKIKSIEEENKSLKGKLNENIFAKIIKKCKK